MALDDRNSPIRGYSPDSDAAANQSPVLIKQEPGSLQLPYMYSSYSIERFVSPTPPPVEQRSGECVSEQDGMNRVNTNNKIKFSVEDILNPNFGTKCDIVGRVVTPIFQSNGKFRPAPRRSLEIPRLPPSDLPARRHSTGTADTGSHEPSQKLNSDGDGELPAAGKDLWPAWVYCTRYSDRPSSGPRSRRIKRKDRNPEDKRPRTAFSGDQLSRLKHEFNENRYLTERRRQDLARELNLNEAQIKIWFQNKRAKMKKAKGEKNPLALQLMAQGLYNHSTLPAEEDEYLDALSSK